MIIATSQMNNICIIFLFLSRTFDNDTISEDSYLLTILWEFLEDKKFTNYELNIYGYADIFVSRINYFSFWCIGMKMKRRRTEAVVSQKSLNYFKETNEEKLFLTCSHIPSLISASFDYENCSWLRPSGYCSDVC